MSQIEHMFLIGILLGIALGYLVLDFVIVPLWGEPGFLVYIAAVLVGLLISAGVVVAGWRRRKI